ncbi:MAG: type II secretion system protein [Planctomycetota bacterium]|nr:type II secretion system protein [Planctomycetota bacterium]
MQMRTKQKAFTLIELMVVIAIIGLLISIATPALSRAMQHGRAMKSSNNLRSWGQGTMLYVTESNDLLPWEGYKTANRMGDNMNEPTWWANAIPERLGEATYKMHYEQGMELQSPNPVPMPGDESIFCDPSADPPTQAPYNGGGVKFFFCYVPNSQLNNTFDGDEEYKQGLPFGIIRKPSDTVLMLEMRANRDELPEDDPFYWKTLNRHRCDWKRFGARHLGGGHIVFGDGHIRRVLNHVVTTNQQLTRDPDEPSGNWNRSNLIWDPQGPAYD